MDISEFSQDDVMFSVHNYDRYANGYTESEVERLLEQFPGETYGLFEKGYEEEQYGHEHIDHSVRTNNRTGKFYRDQIDLHDPDFVVMAGGEFGVCHNDAYEIIREETDDAEFIFPPEACFGYTDFSAPQPGHHTIEQFQKGSLPVEDHQDHFIKIAAEQASFDKYDWSKCSIRRIKA